MPKTMLKDGAQKASKEGEKPTISNPVQPDAAEETREEESVDDTLNEEAVTGEEKEMKEGPNDRSDSEDSEDETQYAGKSPAALLEDGKRFFREKNWVQAAEYFSRAVEHKVKELNHADFHAELGPFYLWFGDVLLIKEEQQAELFRFNQQQQQQQSEAASSGGAPSSPSPPSQDASRSTPEGEEAAAETAAEEREGGNAAGKVSDEELAFEILEMAKKCLAMKLEEAVARQKKADEKDVEAGSAEQLQQQEKAEYEAGSETEVKKGEQQGGKTGEKKEKEQEPTATEVASAEITETTMQQKGEAAETGLCTSAGDEVSEEIRETVMDLSFAHVRLADMLLMNEKYEEAAQDYAAAVELRERYKLPQQTIVAPLLCLAQATFFSGQKKEALCLFQRTHSVGCLIKEGALAMPEGMTATALNETLEDLQLQIIDLEKQIQEEAATASATGVQTVLKKGSQCEARDCIAKTTATFDVPQLASTTAAPVTVFKISPASSEPPTVDHSAAPSAADVARPQDPPASAADPHPNTVGTAVATEDVGAASECKVKKRRIDLRTLRESTEQVKSV